MRVVNLARRPFINRRPIVRVAALLWLAGVLLLGWNLRLYRGHWQGTAENRRLLDEVQGKLLTERQNRDRLAQQLASVDLRELNSRSAFLNSLIAFRTFPWSALFDDLEEVLPAEVKLFNVQPVVRLATDIARDDRLAERRRAAAAERAATRRTSRQRRGAAGAPAAEAERPPAAEKQLGPDEVALQLNGLAKTEDAVIELVDRLFENPAFRRPVLDSERSESGGMTGFSLSVVYLTRRPPSAPPAEEELGAELAEATPERPADGEEAPPDADVAAAERRRPPGAAGEGGEPEARPRSEVSGRDTPGRDTPDRASPRPGAEGGKPIADISSRGTPAAGTPGGTPNRGTPNRGTPNRGTPNRGTPVAGTPVAGTPDRGAPVAETPGPKTADSPPPPEPTPSNRTPDRGTPQDEPRVAERDPAAADRDATEREEDAAGNPPPGGDDEPGLGERDASATPALDSGGQVQLRPAPLYRRWPAWDRPDLVRLAGARALETRAAGARKATEVVA